MMVPHYDMKPIALLTVLITALSQVYCGPFDCILPLTVNGKDIFSKEVVLSEGSNVTITCDLMQKDVHNNLTSSDIDWYKDQYFIPNDHYTIVNRTRISLSLYDITVISGGDYFCMIGKSYVCSSTLHVGRKPSILPNLTVISHDLEDIHITWTIRNAFIATTYTFNYRFSNKGSISCAIADCQNKRKEEVYNCTCYIPSAQLLYLNLMQFVIQGSNELETVNLLETFVLPEHYVKPKPPTNLQVISKNSSMLFISWEFRFSNTPFDLSTLYYEVFYKPILVKENEKNEYKIINTTETTITFNNLSQHRNYSIKIRSKLNYTTSYYSDFAFLNTTTDDNVPQDAPVIAPGMFSIRQTMSSRKVSIYWKDIDKLSYGTPNINYLVNFKNNVKYESFSLTTNHTSIENIELHNCLYKVTINANNSYGPAKKLSTIFIPEQSQVLDNLGVDFFLCLVQPDRLNLSWTPLPKDSSNIVITIYWCKGYRGSLSCLRTLNWTHLTNDRSSWVMPVDLNIRYQVATSVESSGKSSGMRWLSDCNFVTDNFDELDLKFESTADSIKIVWQSPFKQTSVIRNYAITFCPVHECRDVIVENVIPKNSMEFTLTNLRPYTKYNITISINLATGTRIENKNVVFSTKRNNSFMWIIGCVVTAFVVLTVLIFANYGRKLVKNVVQHRRSSEVNLIMIEKAKLQNHKPKIKELTTMKTTSTSHLTGAFVDSQINKF